ncbi:molybdopterin-dependent oxidoreductase [Paenibacillus sp. JTLBN-2024]
MELGRVRQTGAAADGRPSQRLLTAVTKLERIRQTLGRASRFTRLLKKLMSSLRPQTVKFYSGDGVYTDALTLEQAQMIDIMVAVLLDGKPIPSELGPVRLVVLKCAPISP